MNVVIIDYEMGNLGSVRRAFEECNGSRVVISENPKDLQDATHIVLPGVGAFADGLNHLKRKGWLESLNVAVRQGVPLLGICLGMQLLADQGNEGGDSRGLGFISGKVTKLVPSSSEARIPHIGWNEVLKRRPSPLFEAIDSGTDFYFVHSYHFIPSTEEHVIATTPYCGTFVSAVQNENVFGVQFHPEKSSKAGFQVLRNFLKC